MSRYASRILIGALAAALAILATTATAGAAAGLYFSNFNPNAISRVDLPGGNAANLAITPEARTPDGTAIDAATGVVYWANHSGNAIEYADLHGSAAAVLPTAGAPLEEPEALAIYPAAGKLYWANDSGKISWAALDGSGGGELDIAGAPADEPSGVAVDPAADRIYWTNFNHGMSSTIGYANLNGSGGGGTLELPGVAPIGPAGLAIDPLHNTIYWANDDAGSIGYASLAGLGGGLLDTSGAPVDRPDGLAIDPAAEKIYWANGRGDSIGEASLAGGRGERSRNHRPGDRWPVLPGPAGDAGVRRPAHDPGQSRGRRQAALRRRRLGRRPARIVPLPGARIRRRLLDPQRHADHRRHRQRTGTDADQGRHLCLRRNRRRRRREGDRAQLPDHRAGSEARSRTGEALDRVAVDGGEDRDDDDEGHRAVALADTARRTEAPEGEVPLAPRHGDGHRQRPRGGQADDPWR